MRLSSKKDFLKLKASRTKSKENKNFKKPKFCNNDEMKIADEFLNVKIM